MRRYAKVCLPILVVIVLYFGAGAILLRFAVEKHLVVSGTLSGNAVRGNPLTFPSIRGHALTARTLGSGSVGCVVVFPGRHGPSPAYEASVVPPLVQGGVKMYLVAYPGQFNEESRASLSEIRDLARLAVIQVVKECGQNNVVLVGRSLGSMVAAYASREAHVAGVLLESTSPRFSTAIRAEFRRRWYLRPMTVLPVEHLVPEDYSLSTALGASNMPKTVILQGASDEQTPLIDLAGIALPQGVDLVPVADATHSNLFSMALPTYIETIFGMLRVSNEGKDLSSH